MQISRILYQSLPMMRLGCYTDNENIFIAPDFSTLAYMLEEYISLGVTEIVIPAPLREAKMLSDLPILIQKRVAVVDTSAEEEAVHHLLQPLRKEFGLKEDSRASIDMPHDLRRVISNVHSTILQLAVGFRHGLQIHIIPYNAQNLLRHLRGKTTNKDTRALLAQLDGFFALYEDLKFESPKPNKPSNPKELLVTFDRLLKDPDYLQLSHAISALATPESRSFALERVHYYSRQIIKKETLVRGWNYAGKIITTWTGVPVPEGEIFSGSTDWPAQ